MKKLTRILLYPLGLLILGAVILYLAWERRTSPWHRHPMTNPFARRANAGT